MRKWFIETLIAIALSLTAGLFVIVHTAVSRAVGAESGDLDAPGFQLASIGFGAMNLLALSGSVLAALLIIVTIREFRRARSRQPLICHTARFRRIVAVARTTAPTATPSIEADITAKSPGSIAHAAGESS